MFCSNCGKEIKEGSAFCGNCGKQIQTEVKTNSTSFKKATTQIKSKFDTNAVLTKAKKHFTDFLVNYNSPFFKFAMAIILAVGLSDHIVRIINMYLYDIIPTWSKYAYTIYEPALCLLLFGIFALIFTKIKRPETVKPSAILMILWIVVSILNLLIFIIDLELYRYILYSGLAINIVETLLLISIALLLFKNRPKYPFVLVISLISYTLLNMSLWIIKLDILWYHISNELSDFIKILYPNTLGMLVFILACFLVRYLFGDKVSKCIIGVLAVLMTVVNGFSSFDGLSIQNIIDFVTKTAVIVAIVLFVWSCGRNIQPENFAECKTKGSKRILAISVTSVVIAAVVLFAYLLTSAIVCSNHINNGIKKWKHAIVNGGVTTEEEWTEAGSDIIYFSADELVSSFVDDYSFYSTFKENRSTMQSIMICYEAYRDNEFDDEIAEKFAGIKVEDYWRNDDILSVYYEKYIQMKPGKDKVTTNVSIDINNRKINITVYNKNVVPLSSCTVSCHFTIGFIESGYYSSSVEYGRGNRTFTVEDVPGSSEKTIEFDFDPDQYYDSYGSYIMAFVQEKSAEVFSIE